MGARCRHTVARGEFQLFYQAGCDRFAIRLAGTGTDDFLRQARIFAEQIMPFIDK